MKFFVMVWLCATARTAGNQHTAVLSWPVLLWIKCSIIGCLSFEQWLVTKDDCIFCSLHTKWHQVTGSTIHQVTCCNPRITTDLSHAPYLLTESSLLLTHSHLVFQGFSPTSILLWLGVFLVLMQSPPIMYSTVYTWHLIILCST